MEPKQLNKLEKILGLLNSDNVNEVYAAVNQARRILAQNSMRPEDLIKNFSKSIADERVDDNEYIADLLNEVDDLKDEVRHYRGNVIKLKKELDILKSNNYVINNFYIRKYLPLFLEHVKTTCHGWVSVTELYNIFVRTYEIKPSVKKFSNELGKLLNQKTVKGGSFKDLKGFIIE